MDWYYSVGNARQGPVSESVLMDLARQGSVTSGTLVWREGYENWIPFSECNLSQYLATCAVSGSLRPESEMLQYGNSWVLPEHKDRFVQGLQEGGQKLSDQLVWGEYQYVDPKKRANLAKGAMIGVVVFFVLLLVGVGVLAAVDSAAGEGSGKYEGEEFEMILGGIAVFGILIAQIFYMMWLHRVATNAHAILKRRMDQTPGWAVGFNYIPIVSLWKPYVSMKEIWNASQRRRLDESCPLIGWWWAMWVCVNVLGGMVPFFIFPAVILGWIVITKVTNWQRELAGDV